MKTEILKKCDEAELAFAAKLIQEGKLVAFPTETVYGLGGNALRSDAAKRIYEAKGRPSDNPLIIHLACAEDASKYCEPNEVFYRLADAFMPGPLTVILPKKECIPDSVTGGLDTVAVRVPSHPIAHALIAKAGVPIAAPSANISGKPSTTTAAHVITDLDGKVDAILAADDCEIGLESTIVKIHTDGTLTVLRPGAITCEMLSDIVGSTVNIDPAVLAKSEARPLAPGMKYRHYAPHMPVIILDGADDAFYDYVNQKDDCGVLCFEEDLAHITAKKVLSLGKASQAQEQAHRLFACLREMDAQNDLACVYARMPQKSEVGLAVWNRLAKAAGFEVIKLEDK